MQNFRLLLTVVLIICSACSLFAQEGHLQYFGLDQVKLLDSPFKKAQEISKQYILEMDVGRLLAPYMKDAGIAWEAENYGNWENTGLDGHIGGHYLSALALMYASTGDQEINIRLDYMLEQLKMAQDQNGNGYLGGVPKGKKIWEEIKAGNIKAGSFSLNDGWVPLYNIHKIYAGLRDAYMVAGKDGAKDMLINLTDWFMDLTEDFTDEQFQEILISEHGGLNETFADVAVITGDVKYLELARKMSHHHLLDPLQRTDDILTGMHANTQIPKVIGFQRIALVSKDQPLNDASEYFWDNVTNQRSISIGGNSVREHFHSTDDFSPMLSSDQGPETCNTYNMMRLSEMLFQSTPNRKFIDYYERALFNHILSSQHPEKGGYVYFTSMRPQHYRVYSQPHENFWCCVGSGLENHAKYGQVIYAHQEDDLFVNLFIASELDWTEKGVKLIQNTNFPYQEETILSFAHKEKKEFNLKVRYPSWVKSGQLTITINGKGREVTVDRNGYISLPGKWSSKDQIEIALPMDTRAEQLPDGSNWLSFVHGPIVLGAKTGNDDLKGLIADDSRMGHVASGRMIPLEETPVLKKDSDFLPKKAENDLRFTLASNTFHQQEKNIELVPFYTIHDSRYQVYWPLLEEDEIVTFKKQLREKDELILRLEKVTVDQVAAGEQQPETEHDFKGNQTHTGQQDGRFWRSTMDYFQYTLKNPSKEAKNLRITFIGSKENHPFNIVINGGIFKTGILPSEEIGVVEMDYDLSGFESETLDLRIESVEGKPSPKIHHVRLMKNKI